MLFLGIYMVRVELCSDKRELNLCLSVSCATALFQKQVENWWRVAGCSTKADAAAALGRDLLLSAPTCLPGTAAVRSGVLHLPQVSASVPRV